MAAQAALKLAPVAETALERAQRVLERVFGYPSFRSHQASIIEALIEGRDVLALMPTGGGKSLCYQIPSLVRSGTGIVVSPLIALMQDQVDALRELGVKAEGQRPPGGIAPVTSDARPAPVAQRRPASPFASPPSA